MDIVRERLEREYDLELLATTPNVEYQVVLTDSCEAAVHSPADMPDRAASPRFASRHPRHDPLPQGSRGRGDGALPGPAREHVDMIFLSEARVQIHYDLPLAEIVLDFFDHLEVADEGRVARLRADREPRVGPGEARHPARGRAVDALSMVVHQDKAYPGRARARRAAVAADPAPAVRGADTGGDRLEDHRPRKSVKPMRKDVIAKCYGGDITRKRKLLERQKDGKKRMKQVGPDRGAAGGVPGGALAVGRRRRQAVAVCARANAREMRLAADLGSP